MFIRSIIYVGMIVVVINADIFYAGIVAVEINVGIFIYVGCYRIIDCRYF